MEGIFFIKSIGQMQSILNQKSGENIAKLQIVITTKEVRSSDNGTYSLEQDFAIDLLGERASSFSLNQGDWIAASLSFSVRSFNGVFYQDVRLNRYVKL